MASRIDVHHHFVPASYAQALLEAGGDPSGWPTPTWMPEHDLKFMDDHQIQTAILSVTAPGPSITEGAAARQLARRMNEYASALRDSNPSRYGFFATIPSLLDKHGALDEIKYALEILKADGVTLYSRYGNDNHYLGHEDFGDIWDLLDAKSAVVFVHPTHAVDTNLVNAKLPQPMIDYAHETTRTAIDLIVTNTARSHPNCKIILPHAGGTLPYLASRPAVLFPHTALDIGKSTEEFLEDAQSFYFDVGLSTNRYTLALLTAFAKPSHILYGSDYPYAPEPAITRFTKDLDASAMLDAEAKARINRGSALRLFPRLRSFMNNFERAEEGMGEQKCGSK